MTSQSRLCSAYVVVLCVMHASLGSAGTQFASHVSFNTPASRFAYGVGDPVRVLQRRARQRHGALRGFHEGVPLQVLPPSPYRVDSADPESLWPGGLFLAPLALRRAGDGGNDKNALDPYLLEGSEAIAAVAKSTRRGHLYFHDIPHINSLLANQEMRIHNNLKPHRIASIRQTWPYNRP